LTIIPKEYKGLLPSDCPKASPQLLSHLIALERAGDKAGAVSLLEGLVVSPNENNRRARALRQLLGTRPPAGMNTVVISHRPNLIDAAGKEFGDMGEGETAIFQPLGDGEFTLVGRVTANTWIEWAK